MVVYWGCALAFSQRLYRIIISPQLLLLIIPARRRSIRSLSNKGVVSCLHTIQIGMAGPTPFDSWMERATAEFFDKLASIKQTVADDRFVCRLGLEDVYFVEYGDHQSLLQALVSNSSHQGDHSHKW